MKEIEADEFLKRSREFPVVDTRSPAEFASGHIPGAVNLPLFENSERKIIGTLYKQQGKKEAIKAGLRITGPKMLGFIEKVESLRSQNVLVHCWRGGMRSQSMAWLLELYGFDVWIMKGGYKAYRNALLEFFKNPPQLRVITGSTGSMKTVLLKKLREMDEQVVDLEALANHPGSSFGNQVSTGQPSTEQFQNDLFADFFSLDPDRPVWLEDESFSIGKVHLVEGLYRNMQLSPHYLVLLSREKRIDVLLSEYGQIPKDKLVQAVQGIAKKLGKNLANQAIECVHNDKLAEAVEIILNYYDRAYSKGIQKKQDLVLGPFHLNVENMEETAGKLINYRK
ncbi:tRNA 2-selenouridine(34) synthase MnmH [Cyclobacterium jeungdonense]|uniref:tRNA 2-selenouridine(34) synthase MnmH n=1 Tax=Cyclobacterium jeungdonense TaxID=708087 RepID=A0ABT8C8G2_9BACT|nr:tRNA 2-selenouridine(34) synthase MnmH [Cyclobacterium jeungdonense]MDN3687976.1 tRNA 2-selenouridine(34) synthase MnmH [Cyclobacterium jeungdonense]